MRDGNYFAPLSSSSCRADLIKYHYTYIASRYVKPSIEFQHSKHDLSQVCSHHRLHLCCSEFVDRPIANTTFSYQLQISADVLERLLCVGHCHLSLLFGFSSTPYAHLCFFYTVAKESRIYLVFGTLWRLRCSLVHFQYHNISHLALRYVRVLAVLLTPSPLLTCTFSMLLSQLVRICVSDKQYYCF